MSLPRELYLAVYTVYILFFGLFLRFYIWRRYTQTQFWQTRPSVDSAGLADLCREMGRDAPFISILVPARNEADVIENTVRHISGLDYPPDRFEVIVATDEKEVIRARASRKALLSRVRSTIARRTPGGIADLSFEEAQQYKSILLYGLAYLCAPEDDVNRVFELLRTIAEDPSSAPSLFGDLESLKDLVLGLFSLYITMTGETPRRVPADNAGAGFPLPDGDFQESLWAKAQLNLRRAGSRRFDAEMYKALIRLYPTTQEVLDRLLSAGGDLGPRIKHVVVPDDFDGRFRGKRTGRSVPSTKGRALNWALGFLDPRCEVCGFYDAESRPHQQVLAYVAYRTLLDPRNSNIFQGPVFQVRNFYQMGLFCRIASLYQAVAHDWYLPWLFKTLPFVGGTNLFVRRELLEKLGAWDCEGLTEDLEFGTRAYLAAGAWPEFLPYPSSEQTPPTYKAFFRQRLRWATGHLQVVNKVAEARFAPEDRRQELLFHLVLKGQVEWVVYQLATFVPPTALFLQFADLLDETVVPAPARWLLTVFSAIYFSFTFYAFVRYRPYFDKSRQPDTLLGMAGVVAGLLFLPLAAFLFPVPFTSALVLKMIGKEPRHWVKTPRTRERAA